MANEVEALAISLQTNPKQGTSLGGNSYKIRLGIASKGQGKSGSARVITCVIAVTTEVYLLSIYDKAEQDSLTDTELQALINEIPTL